MWEGGLLWLLILFSGAAVAGFATFGQNPALLSAVPWALSFYGPSYTVFSLGQILLAGGVLSVVLALRAPPRWVLAFGASYVVSLASELAGTNVGFPFGHYSYGGGLGPKWFEDVPWVIPLSWFMMAVPSYYLAGRVAGAGRRWLRVGLGALILTAWDVPLDPAMSYATSYWIWESSGPFYGMPWVNLGGWLLTSVAIMAILEAMEGRTWIDGLPGSWLAVFYASNVLLAVGIAAGAGLWGAVAATAGVYGALGALAWGLWAARSTQERWVG